MLLTLFKPLFRSYGKTIFYNNEDRYKHYILIDNYKKFVQTRKKFIGITNKSHTLTLLL